MKRLMGLLGFKVLLVSLGMFIATCDANQPIEGMFIMSFL